MNVTANVLAGKAVLSLALIIMSWVNWRLDPTEYVTLGQGGSIESIRAAMFALIAAVAFFVASIPWGQDHPHSNWVHALCHTVGAIAAFATGWYWLDSEVEGNPGPYVYALFGFGAVMVGLILVPALFSGRSKPAKPEQE